MSIPPFNKPSQRWDRWVGRHNLSIKNGLHNPGGGEVTKAIIIGKLISLSNTKATTGDVTGQGVLSR